jgi:hypothetical protein
MLKKRKRFFAAVLCGLKSGGFLPTNGGTMLTRHPEADVMEQARQALAARIARDGRRHGWPQKLIKPDASPMSQNNKSRYRFRPIPRSEWAAKCCEAVYRAYMKTVPRLSPFPITI